MGRSDMIETVSKALSHSECSDFAESFNHLVTLLTQGGRETSETIEKIMEKVTHKNTNEDLRLWSQYLLDIIWAKGEDEHRRDDEGYYLKIIDSLFPLLDTDSQRSLVSNLEWTSLDKDSYPSLFKYLFEHALALVPKKSGRVYNQKELSNLLLEEKFQSDLRNFDVFSISYLMNRFGEQENRTIRDVKKIKKIIKDIVKGLDARELIKEYADCKNEEKISMLKNFHVNFERCFEKKDLKRTNEHLYFACKLLDEIIVGGQDNGKG